MRYLCTFFLLITLSACQEQKATVPLVSSSPIETVDHTLTDLTKIGEGVVVFTKTDCSRCEEVLTYLEENGRDYKTLNITESDQNAAIMWQLLETVGYEGEEVATPVMVVHGKVSYNHEDLSDFLKTL